MGHNKPKTIPARFGLQRYRCPATAAELDGPRVFDAVKQICAGESGYRAPVATSL